MRKFLPEHVNRLPSSFDVLRALSKLAYLGAVYENPMLSGKAPTIRDAKPKGRRHQKFAISSPTRARTADSARSL